jgi:hypothetical protein
MTGPWAVSIYAVKTLLQAVTEEAAVLSHVGALCAVLSHGVAGLSEDMTADILLGAVTFLHCVGQDVAPTALFKGDEARGEVYSQSASEHIR